MHIIVFIWFIMVQVYCIPDRHEEHKGIPNYFLMEDHSPSLHVRVDMKGSKVIANPAGLFVTTESHPGHSHSLAGGGTSRSAVSRHNTSLNHNGTGGLQGPFKRRHKVFHQGLIHNGSNNIVYDSSGVKRDFTSPLNKHAFHRKLPVDRRTMVRNHTSRSKLYRTETTGHDTVRIHHKTAKARRRLLITHAFRNEVPLTKSLDDVTPPNPAAPITRLFNITKSTIADFNSPVMNSKPISKIKSHRKKGGEVDDSDDKSIPDFNTINAIKVDKIHHAMYDDTSILEPNAKNEETFVFQKVAQDASNDPKSTDPNTTNGENVSHHKGETQDASDGTNVPESDAGKVENVHYSKGEAQVVSDSTNVPESDAGKVESVHYHKSEAQVVSDGTKVLDPDAGKVEKVHHKKHVAQDVTDNTRIIDPGTNKGGKDHQMYSAQDVSDGSRKPDVNTVAQDFSTDPKLTDPNTTKVEKVHHRKGEPQDVSGGKMVTEADTGKVENVHHRKSESQDVSDGKMATEADTGKVENVHHRKGEAQDVSDGTKISEPDTGKLETVHLPKGEAHDVSDGKMITEADTGKMENVHYRIVEAKYVPDGTKVPEPDIGKVEKVHYKKHESQDVADNAGLSDLGTTKMENVNQKYAAQGASGDSKIPEHNTVVQYTSTDTKLTDPNTTKVEKVRHHKAKAQDVSDNKKVSEPDTGKVETVHHRKYESQNDSNVAAMTKSNRTGGENVYYQQDKANDDSDDTKMQEPNTIVTHNKHEAPNVSDDTKISDPETIKVSSIVTTWSKKPSNSKEQDVNSGIKEDELVNTKIFNETTTLKNGETIEHSFSLKNKNFSIITQANFFGKEKPTNKSTTLKDMSTVNESAEKENEKSFDHGENDEKVASQNFHAKSRKHEENRIEKQNPSKLIEKFRPKLVEVGEKEDNSSSQRNASNSVDSHTSDGKEKQSANEDTDLKKPNIIAHKKENTIDSGNVTQMNFFSNDSSSSDQQNSTISPIVNNTMHLLTERKLNATKAVISDVLDAVKEELFLRLHSTGTLKLLNRSGDPDLAKQILNETINGNEKPPSENKEEFVKSDDNKNNANEATDSNKTEESKGQDTVFIRSDDTSNSEHFNETNANKSIDENMSSKNFSNLSSDNQSAINSDETSNNTKLNEIADSHENSTSRSSESTITQRSSDNGQNDQVIWDNELRNGGKEVEPKQSLINVDPAAEDLYGHENVLHSIHEDYGNSDYSDIQIDYHADPVSHNVESTGGLAYNHMDILPHYRRGRSNQYRESGKILTHVEH